MELVPTAQFETGGEPTRDSGIVRIVGGQDTDRAHAQEWFKSVFRHQEPHRRERQKTPEELHFVQQVNERMKEFIQKYGGMPISIAAEQIHFVDDRPSKAAAAQPEQNMSCHGFYNPEKQQIVIYHDKDVAPLWQAIVLAHEIIHFNSFQQYIVRLNKGRRLVLQPQIIGLDVLRFRDGQVTALFRGLHEAVVTELTKRFDREYFETLDYTQADAERRNAGTRWEEEQNAGNAARMSDAALYLTRRQADGTFKEVIEQYDYIRERQKLWNLIDQILHHDQESFEDKEEVFALFAKAVLAGPSRTLVEIVEGTRGRGAWLRLGEQTSYRTPHKRREMSHDHSPWEEHG